MNELEKLEELAEKKDELSKAADECEHTAHLVAASTSGNRTTKGEQRKAGNSPASHEARAR